MRVCVYVGILLAAVCAAGEMVLGYAVIGQSLSDSAIGAVSTGVCLLNFTFISFVDAFRYKYFMNWHMGLDIFVLHFCKIL